MTVSDILRLADKFLQNLRSDGENTIVADCNAGLFEDIFSPISKMEIHSMANWMNRHLGILLSLQSSTPHNRILQELISACFSSCLPVGINGLLLREKSSLHDNIEKARSRWVARGRPVSECISIVNLLNQKDTWNAGLSNGIASFLYRSTRAQSEFWTWLTRSQKQSEEKAKVEIDDRLLLPLYAFFDSYSNPNDTFEVSDASVKLVFEALAKRLYCTRGNEEKAQALLIRCLANMLFRFPVLRDTFVKYLSKRLRRIPVELLHRESIILLSHCHRRHISSITSLADAVLEHALKWATRHLSDTAEKGALDAEALDSISEAFFDLIILRLLTNPLPQRLLFEPGERSVHTLRIQSLQLLFDTT
jgi:hypothetical protein